MVLSAGGDDACLCWRRPSGGCRRGSGRLSCWSTGHTHAVVRLCLEATAVRADSRIPCEEFSRREGAVLGDNLVARVTCYGHVEGRAGVNQTGLRRRRLRRGRASWGRGRTRRAMIDLDAVGVTYLDATAVILDCGILQCTLVGWTDWGFDSESQNGGGRDARRTQSPDGTIPS